MKKQEFNPLTGDFNLYNDASEKADKVVGAIPNNIASIDDQGNLIDSGTNVASLLALPTLPDVDFSTTINDSLTGLASRDGHTPVVGQFALIKNQTDGDQSIYRVTPAGNNWIRQKVVAGSYVDIAATDTTYASLGINFGTVLVKNGTVNRNRQFRISIATPTAIYKNSQVSVTSISLNALINPSTAYVSSSIGNDTDNIGTSDFPYATILKAINTGTFPKIVRVDGQTLSGWTYPNIATNVTVQSDDLKKMAGKTQITSVITLPASANARISHVGLTLSQGTIAPLGYSGVLTHERCSWLNSATTLLSLHANMPSSTIEFRSVDSTSAPLAAVDLPDFVNTQNIWIHEQHLRLPFKVGTNGSQNATIIISSTCLPGAVRVPLNFKGTILRGHTPISSVTEVINTQSALDSLISNTSGTDLVPRFYLITGFIPTQGEWLTGAIIGKQSASGFTEHWIERSWSDAAPVTDLSSGKEFITKAIGVWSNAGSETKITYQSSSITKPASPNSGDMLIITNDGTRAGVITEQWIYDNTAWIIIQGSQPVSGAVLDNTIGNSLLATTVGRYIVPTTGLLNAFVGQENKFADWNGTTWTFSNPTEGNTVLITSGTNANQVWRFSAGIWTRRPLPINLPIGSWVTVEARVTQPTLAEGFMRQGTSFLVSAYPVVGNAFGTNVISNALTATIPDQLSWLKVNRIGNSLLALAFGPPNQLNTSIAALSTNAGTSWTRITLPDSRMWRCAAANNNGSIAIAVAENMPQIARSTDGGLTWNLITPPVAANAGLCVHNGTVFVVFIGGTRHVLTSQDGTTWTYRANVLPGIPGFGPAVTVGANGRIIYSYANGVCVYSDDNGVSWNLSSNAPTATTEAQMAYGKINGVDTLVLVSFQQTYWYSQNNGLSWTSAQMPINAQWRTISFANGTFAASSFGSSTIYFSPAPNLGSSSWVLHTAPFTGFFIGGGSTMEDHVWTSFNDSRSYRFRTVISSTATIPTRTESGNDRHYMVVGF